MKNQETKKQDFDARCVVCKTHHDFILPDEILEAAINGELVIFAGAGISTENKIVFYNSLYTDLKNEIRVKGKDSLPFPELVSKYSEQINGRKKFLQKIKNRFDYVHQFSELYTSATRFHRELSTMWPIETIITTNWDDYFERECSAIPIVTPEDFAFYDLPGRKVYKIHGSINNYGSIIASSEDYKRCYKSLNVGIIGSYLKTILATKVILFVGFSFRDFDFIKIHQYLVKELKGILPHSYIVTLDEGTKDRVANFSTTIIKTDASYFIKILKKHLVEKKIMMEDEIYEDIPVIKSVLSEIHHKYIFKAFDFSIFPWLIYCAFYQDGMLHAFDFIMHSKKSGLSSNYHYMINSFSAYEELKKERIKEKQYHDVAYITGYMGGLTYLIANKKQRAKFPLFYLYGCDLVLNRKTFEKYLIEAGDFHKPASKWASTYIKRNKMTEHPPVDIHHTPFL
jgi:hypothetical protein